MTSRAEREVRTEEFDRLKRYGPFAQWALGISPLNPDWELVERLSSGEETAGRLAEASELVLSGLSKNTARKLRLRYGLESLQQTPMSEVELGKALGVSASTVSRILKKAQVSVDFGGRLEPLKDFIASQRPQVLDSYREKE